MIDKVVVITGAASGIGMFNRILMNVEISIIYQYLGRAVAIRFSKENAKIVVADMNETKGNETVKIITDAGKKGICLTIYLIIKNIILLNLQATFIHVDCSDENSIKNLMYEANVWGGNKGIQVLVNNAAAFVFGHLAGAGSGSGTFTDKDISLADWAKVLNTNIVGYAK